MISLSSTDDTGSFNQARPSTLKGTYEIRRNRSGRTSHRVRGVASDRYSTQRCKCGSRRETKAVLKMDTTGAILRE